MKLQARCVSALCSLVNKTPLVLRLSHIRKLETDVGRSLSASVRKGKFNWNCLTEMLHWNVWQEKYCPTLNESDFRDFFSWYM